MQHLTERQARLEAEFDSSPSITRIKHRARVSDLSDFRSRDRKRNVPRDLRWQLGGMA